MSLHHPMKSNRLLQVHHTAAPPVAEHTKRFLQEMEIDLTEAFKTCYTFHIDCSFDKMNLIWDVVTGLFEVNHI